MTRRGLQEDAGPVFIDERTRMADSSFFFVSFSFHSMVPSWNPGACPSPINIEPTYTATLKIAGTLQKSSEVMSMVNSLVKLPEISMQMQEMTKEMMKVL